MRLGDCACCRRNGRSLGNRYGPGTGPIWLDELNCRGSETQLGNCPHRGWSSNDCSHSEDVSIACSNDPSSRGLYNLWLISLCYQRRIPTTKILRSNLKIIIRATYDSREMVYFTAELFLSRLLIFTLFALSAPLEKYCRCLVLGVARQIGSGYFI